MTPSIAASRLPKQVQAILLPNTTLLQIVEITILVHRGDDLVWVTVIARKEHCNKRVISVSGMNLNGLVLAATSLLASRVGPEESLIHLALVFSATCLLLGCARGLSERDAVEVSSPLFKAKGRRQGYKAKSHEGGVATEQHESLEDTWGDNRK
ncbi:uncharacterized protein PG998_003874 [Apiospora kogelbergensis]|uniref:uncharacterized protein n=1 Tax=Apiospora kogelbergensis TaxID=1337665 RepID=UPI00312E229F